MSTRICKQADINIAASGDNTVVLAVSARPILVWQIWMVNAGTVISLKFGNGDATQSPTFFNAVAFPLSGNGGSLTFQQTDQPWWTTTVGKGFSINLSGAQQITGRIYYTEG